MLVLFLEKALTLIHMETHLNDVSTTFQAEKHLENDYLRSI